MKKAIASIVNIISVAVIVLATVALLSVVLSKDDAPPQILGYSAFRVMTGSMEPTIPTDSMILVKHVDPSEIEVGDVITFYSPDPELQGAVNTHRVTDIIEDGSARYFYTKGDANPVKDNYPVEGSSVLGVVVGSSLFFGKIVRLVNNPIIFAPVIILPLLVMLIMNITNTVKIAKKLEKEEEEKALEQMADALRKRKENLEQAEKDETDNHMKEETTEEM